ncbi:hypothetical protein JCM11957_03320 [Caminibacter profundus]
MRHQTIHLNENSKHDLDNKKFKKLKKLLEEFHGVLTLNNLQGVEYYPQSKTDKDNENILTLKYENGKEYIYTHNMVGEIYYKDELKISIGLRFENEYSVLEYLLDVADSFYLNESILNYNPKSTIKKTNTLSEFILFKMFINSLKQAVIFGFPFSYSTYQEKDYNIKGSIDIKKLYSQEIPFKGKTPYIKNERIIVTSIALVLLNVINYIILNKNYKDPTLSKIKNDLMQYNLNIPLNKRIIQKALNHNILNNPLYSEYKQTLYLAKLILEITVLISKN